MMKRNYLSGLYNWTKLGLKGLAFGVALTLNQVNVYAGENDLQENFKIAFVGDTQGSEKFENLLNLIKNEETDLVVQAGDLGYRHGFIGWSGKIKEVLDDVEIPYMGKATGEPFPYLITKGNHEAHEEGEEEKNKKISEWFNGYGPWLQERLEYMGAECSGNINELAGMNTECLYKGIKFLMSTSGEEDDTGLITRIANDRGISVNAPIETEENNVSFIEDILSQSEEIWKICAWHRSRYNFNLQGKPNDVPIESYILANDYGAIVAQAHSHTYSRSLTIENIVAFDEDNETGINNEIHGEKGEVNLGSLELNIGNNFVFDSSLGGRAKARLKRCEDENRNFIGCPNGWGGWYREEYGALFLEFYINGNPREARGYFKDVKGNLIDNFEIVSKVGSDIGFKFIRGDSNNDRRLNIGDVVHSVFYQYGINNVETICEDSIDVNDDGLLNLSDSIYLISFLFELGGPPKEPYPEIGFDPTRDNLRCES